jgi:hypothetical protein
MGIKNFLKPNWKKIAIFMIIWMVPFILLVFNFNLGSCYYAGIESLQPFYCNLGYFLFPSTLFSSIITFEIIIASIVFYYLAACLMSYIKYKQFLKPSIVSVILFISLSLISIFYVTLNPQRAGGVYIVSVGMRGLPFAFYACTFTEQLLLTAPIPSPFPECDFSYLNLVINLASWYLVSCFIIWGFYVLRGNMNAKKNVSL